MIKAIKDKMARLRGGGHSQRQADEERFAWLMISPSLLVLLLVTTVPILVLVGMSLAQIDLTSPQPGGFAGLENFTRMVEDDRFWHALIVMVIYAIATVVLELVIGLALALALFRSAYGQRLLTVAVLLPMVLAPVVVGLAWRTLLLTPEYGLIDYMSQLVGLGSQPWLSDPTLALASVIVIHTWQWTPFAFLVFLASLHALPPEPFEAARVDGASEWQIFWRLILPLLKPVIIIVAMLRLVIALRAFDAILAATGGGPGTATEILNLFIYRVAFTSLELGYGAALALLLLIVTVVASWLFFRYRTSLV